jgi:FkbH-like protein
MRTVHCALLSSFTLSTLPQLVSKRMAELGIKLEWYVSPFNQYAQEILNPSSGLLRGRQDIVFLAVDVQDLLKGLPELWTTQSVDRLSLMEKRINEYIRLLEALAVRLPQTRVFVHNFVRPDVSPNALLDYNVPGSMSEMVLRCNLMLVEKALALKSVNIMDVAGVFARSGLERSYDARYFYLGCMRFSGTAMEELADLYERNIRAELGIRKKCIVLDLDGTIWGGVLGEEGAEHIMLSDHGLGKAFQDAQRVLLNYHRAGILLAISSKNDGDLALKTIEEHPHMILRTEHFVAMRINWRDKATNLMEIADELNIGLDSLVFVDDSPFEREHVRHALPKVMVVDLPSEACDYPRWLANLTCFDTLSVTEEDKHRSKMYREERQRKEIRESAGSLEEFLRTLNIRAKIRPPDEFSIPRIAQLTQKTNQFNLTARPYTESDIIRFSKSDKWNIYCLDVEDKIGSSGIVGVAIVELDRMSRLARLDTFLLSCRILGRGIESAFLGGIIRDLKAYSIQVMVAEFLPTSRNHAAEEFLPTHHFVMEGKVWKSFLDSSYDSCPDWIELSVLRANDEE